MSVLSSSLVKAVLFAYGDFLLPSVLWFIWGKFDIDMITSIYFTSMGMSTLMYKSDWPINVSSMVFAGTWKIYFCWNPRHSGCVVEVIIRYLCLIKERIPKTKSAMRRSDKLRCCCHLWSIAILENTTLCLLIDSNGSNWMFSITSILLIGA